MATTRTTASARLGMLAVIVSLALVAGACSDSDDSAEQSDDTAQDQVAFAFQPLELGPVTFAALESGDIDIAQVLSTDGAIAENDWVLLEDDKQLQGSENLIPLVRTESNDETVTTVLDGVSAELSTEGLTELNRRVDVEREDPSAVAEAFLRGKGLLDVAEPGGSGSLTVGSTNFSENQIVANMYALALEANGYEVEVRDNLGSREIVYPALESGELDIAPEYVQSLLVFLDESAGSVTPEEGVTRLGELLPESLEVLAPAEAQDRNALVVTAETAQRYDLETISDLAAVKEPLVLGAPAECPERPLCIPGYEETYGLRFDT